MENDGGIHLPDAHLFGVWSAINKSLNDDSVLELKKSGVQLLESSLKVVENEIENRGYTRDVFIKLFADLYK